MNKFISLLSVSLVLACQTTPILAQSKEKKPKEEEAKKTVDMGQILLTDELWQMKISDFKEKFADYGFEWMSANEDRLRSEGKNIQTFGEKSGEVLVYSDAEDFLKGFTIMVYNKGDDGNIALSEFNKAFDTYAEHVTTNTGDKAEDKSKRGTVRTKKLFWKKDKTAFQLEKSVNASSGEPEFIRLRVASLSSARDGGSTANRSALKSNVVEDEETGDVYIANIPMVDQGKKGYCACATAARIYQYYGRQTDQHEMAQIAGASAEMGTRLNEMVEALKRVTGKLNSRVIVLYEYPKGLADLPTKKDGDDYNAYMRAFRKLEIGLNEIVRDVNNYQRLAKKKGGKSVKGGDNYDKVDRDSLVNMDAFYSKCDGEIFREVMMDKSSYKRFMSKIKEYIDQGIPVGWCLQLGLFPEPDLPQARGGHMRLIIGYNEAKNELIYSDSWGHGHGKKSMDSGKAFCMTMGLLVMPPTR
ncbi:hypothetical protein SAMN02745181_2537 [Rubritalea squalenifaciens DSM 18772]|uniref:Peptidase C39-like domain-containing protein n=1 Tax=Rubritalea squalenifaciens DSM 18772 TaxID=1123071 RepID=A0A1M6LY84_9BACT|nr:C39 family peptidase [Rubritalea squalenifaciens]SHJ76013.1 hypothetical protein SAMN02745181_2537 [Rubritalea squalenifaciens DSM 18772]